MRNSACRTFGGLWHCFGRQLARGPFPAMLGTIVLYVLSSGLVACVETATTLCGTGAAARRCGLGAVCVDGERCEQATNVAACGDLADGAECVLDGRELGHCRSGVCARTFCGDRVVDVGEVCDDGNARDGDGCSADCASSEVCGNGLVDTAAHEQCDNVPRGMSGDGCNSRCGLESLVFDSPEAEFAENGAFVFDRSRNVPVLIARDLTGVMEWHRTHWKTFFREPPLVLSQGDVAVFTQHPQTGQAMVLSDDTAVMWTGNGWQRWTPFTPLDLQLFNPISFSVTANTLTQELWTFDFSSVSRVVGVWWTGAQWSYKRWLTTDSSISTTQIRLEDWRIFDESSKRWIVVARDLRTGLRRNTARFTSNLSTDTTTVHVTYGPSLPPAAEMPENAVSGVVEGRSVPTIIVGSNFWELVGNAWRKLPARVLAYEGAQLECAAVGANGHYCFDGFALQSRDDRLDATPSTVSQIPELASAPMLVAYSPWQAVTAFVGVRPNELDARLRVLHGHGLRGARATLLPNRAEPSARSEYSWTASEAGFLLFGGSQQANSDTQVANVWLSELWRWTGAQWQIENAMPQPRPPARGEHCAFYDSRWHELVVFGGRSATVLGDTWVYDGTQWREILGGGPPPRRNAACTWDEARHVGYLFGGEAIDGSYLNDMWEWTGRQWSQVVLQRAPLPRTAAAIVYHYKTGSVFLIGGYTTAGVLNDVWEFQPSTRSWVNRSTLNQDSVRLFKQSVAYDAIEDAILLIPKVAADNSSQAPSSLKFLVAGTLPDACDGSDNDGDGLLACADPDCWARCQPTCLPHTSCTSAVNTGPRCSDGVCGAVEDAALCPQDCS